MIDREKLNKFIDVMDRLSEERATLSLEQDGSLTLQVYPANWWSGGKRWSDERRHEMLSLITPLIGKLEKVVTGKDIGYRGQKDDVVVRLSYVDQCKIIGYKTVKKTIRKEVEREPEYETEDVEERVPITDCQIRMGQASESDIEVPA